MRKILLYLEYVYTMIVPMEQTEMVTLHEGNPKNMRISSELQLDGL